MLALEDGQKFERYQIIRHLGNGISGISYEAEDLLLQRRVTLKLIHPWAPLPDSARRQFFRDMQSLSLLTHPHQTTLIDYGESATQLYIVRHFAPSGSLLNPNGRQWFSPLLPLKPAIAYAHQIAHALYALHRFDHIHGSLTFSNILISLDSAPTEHRHSLAPFMLADAGLAQFVRRFGRPRMDRLPITAAPEQWQGQITPASDQYALAVILYFWLSGHPPFVGSPEQIEQAKRNTTFPTLRTLNPMVNFEQEKIIHRALNASPEARYPSVVAFTDALRASLSTTPLTHNQTISTPPEIRTEPLVQSISLEEGITETTDPTYTSTPEEHPSEPLSSTFMLDQALLQKLTAIAKQEQSASSNPEPQPQIEPDTPKPHPQSPTPQVPQKESQPPKPDAPKPTAPEPFTPEPDIATPLPLPEQTPLPTTEPGTTKQAPEQEQTEIKTQQTEKSSLSSLQDKYTQHLQLLVKFPLDNEVRTYVLEKTETTLGRAGSSDILLDQDNLTSRHHALIKREGDSYTLYDRRSNNGISVNGTKIVPETAQPLSDGDSIQIGDYSLTVKYIPVSIQNALDSANA